MNCIQTHEPGGSTTTSKAARHNSLSVRLIEEAIVIHWSLNKLFDMTPCKQAAQ
jgi:hypothetical protein